MSVNLHHYKEMLAQPWGKIQYEITFAQLAHLKQQTILDFGAGFGLVSQFLSQHNHVTAIEPDANMLYAYPEQTFEKIHGSLEALKALPSQHFDVICCHNVLEYIAPSERSSYLQEFSRLLKPQGRLSIIKHNPVGKVLQSVVFSNDIDTALALLDGKEFQSLSFSQGSTYQMEDLLAETDFQLEKYLGIRTFYSLQPNHFKTEEGWIDRLLKMELAVADQAPYKDISFLQHVWLKK